MDQDIIRIVDQQIFSGRQAQSDIDSRYYTSRDNNIPEDQYVPDLLNIYNAWQKETVGALNGVVEEFYVSQFIHAQPSIFIRAGNIKWNNIRNKLQGQLDELVSLRRSLERRGGNVINISGESNKAMIGSVDNSVNLSVINSHIEEISKKFEEEYNHPDKNEVRQLIAEVNEAAKAQNATKVRALGGTLLSKVSELAGIAGLVIQLIQMF